MVVADFKGQPPDEQSRPVASINAGHRQTVPIAADEDNAPEVQDLPPPYETASAPANVDPTTGQNADGLVNATPANMATSSTPDECAESNADKDTAEATATANMSASPLQNENGHAGDTDPDDASTSFPRDASALVYDAPANRGTSPAQDTVPPASPPHRSGNHSSSVNSEGYQPPERMSTEMTTWPLLGPV